ncbi:hypothetical protein [Methylomonas sp. UP202]|uniref:hypothetical protein n=1 Tax=Methylomonas sp. UP202 TaxID=3040943 RepID=UPI00247861E3|nr:hypothetical protein [Methylomonas sp. UP202]WGS83867.1 hypothetical protein QC632_12445 [Methylomonas sp. UP202]
MITSSVSNPYGLQQVYGTEKRNTSSQLPEADQTASNINSKPSGANVIDFTNMSPREFGGLVYTGQLGVDAFNVMPINGLDFTKDIRPQFEGIQDVKSNYLAIYKQMSETSKKAGLDTTKLDEQIRKMESFQGQDFTQKTVINAYA